MTNVERASEAVDALPSTVRIGPFDFALIPWTTPQAQAAHRYGECSSIEQVIRIQRDMASPTKCVDTLVHEVSHAFWWAYGIEDGDKEERIVGVLGTAWTAFYRDNPWFLDWVKAALT